ncbi:MAG: hypothetical protein IKG04_08205 [Exiguobacterium sp.]|nr:hypothetical protein [Exiguobacterium sp.]
MRCHAPAQGRTRPDWCRVSTRCIDRSRRYRPP